MHHIANQIITVCAYLTNFHSALVPPPNPDDMEMASDQCSDQGEESESIAPSDCSSSIICDIDID